MENNNRLGWTAPETGGIKVHSFTNGLVEGNIVLNNNGPGIWLDNVYRHSRVTRNVVVGNGSGIFVEMGFGPVMVDNNILALNTDGLYAHDASGITAAHNLMYGNKHFGLYMRVVTERTVSVENGPKQEVETSNERILNNIFIDNYRGQISLPVPSERVQNNISDYNLFVSGSQWQWEGLRFNSFVLNQNDGRISDDRLVEIAREGFSASDIPKAVWPNFKRLAQQPLLDLQEWRAITGFDRNSLAPAVHKGEIRNGAIEKGSVSFSPHELFIDFSNSHTFTQLKVPKVEGINQDFTVNGHRGRWCCRDRSKIISRGITACCWCPRFLMKFSNDIGWNRIIC